MYGRFSFSMRMSELGTIMESEIALHKSAWNYQQNGREM